MDAAFTPYALGSIGGRPHLVADGGVFVRQDVKGWSAQHTQYTVGSHLSTASTAWRKGFVRTAESATGRRVSVGLLR
jgi:hypothetical protein